MGAIALRLLLHPYSLIGIAALLAFGWAFNQGKNYEKRAEARRIEATNTRIRQVNAREEAIADQEETARQRAFTAAFPVLAAAGKCIATPEVAAALSRIR